MTSPLVVGITPLFIPGNKKRASIMFQNTGLTVLYFKRQLTEFADLPSPTNYDFAIGANTVFDPDSFISTNSTSPFYVVSSVVGGIMAIFETFKV